MTPDDNTEEMQRCFRLLRDVFCPETDAILHAYVGMDTKDGPAHSIERLMRAPTDADAITALVGEPTYDA